MRDISQSVGCNFDSRYEGSWFNWQCSWFNSRSVFGVTACACLEQTVSRPLHNLSIVAWDLLISLLSCTACLSGPQKYFLVVEAVTFQGNCTYIPPQWSIKGTHPQASCSPAVALLGWRPSSHSFLTGIFPGCTVSWDFSNKGNLCSGNKLLASYYLAVKLVIA